MKSSLSTVKVRSYKVPFTHLVPGTLYETDSGDIVLCTGMGFSCLLHGTASKMPAGIAKPNVCFGVLFRPYDGAICVSND